MIVDAVVKLGGDVLAGAALEVAAAEIARARAAGRRLVVVHEANRLCGVGAEVAAIVSEKAFDALTAPVIRLTGPDAPAASSWVLEQASFPQPDAIRAAAMRLVGVEMAAA